jgi:hypothetical protein
MNFLKTLAPIAVLLVAALLIPVFSQAAQPASPAQYYAPSLLSPTSIARGDVPIPSFDLAKGIDWNQTHFIQVHIDLDQMMHDSLRAMQDFNKIALKFHERKTLSEIRAKLAQAISERVVKIYTSPDQVAEGRVFYQEALKQDLDFAYNHKAAILRKIVGPPSLPSPHFSRWKEADATLETARFFNYEFTYSPILTQDVLHIEVLDEKTVPPLVAQKTEGKGPDSDLVARLVQFHSLYPQIEGHLSDKDSTIARAAALDLFDKITKAYGEWREPASPPTHAPVSGGVSIHEGRDAQGDFVAEMLLEKGTEKLAGAELIFDGFHTVAGSTEHSFLFVDSAGKHLSWKVAHGLPHRLRFEKLDALAFHNVSARAWVVRNAEVKNGDSSVMPEFILESGPSGIATPLNAELTHSERFDLGKIDDSHQKHPLAFYVEALYANMLGKSANTPVLISLELSGYLSAHPSLEIPLLKASDVPFRSVSDWTHEGACTDNDSSPICYLIHGITEAYRHVHQSQPLGALHFSMKVSQDGETKLVLPNVVLDLENVD